MSPDALFLFGAALLGPVIGSFLNVVIHRLPKMMEAEWRAQCAELNGAAVADAGSYNLAVEQPHIALPALLSHLQATGRTLAHLTTRHATLEDVFVSLTGRHLEESANGQPA